MLDRVEWHSQRQIGQTGMNTGLLVDRHLVLFETKIAGALLQHANQQVVRELILIGKPRSRDRLQSGQKRFVGLMVPHDGIERIVIQLVVITVIAESGGALRIIAQIRLVLLVEESLLRRQAVSQSFGLLGRNQWSKSNQKDCKIPAHSPRRLSKRTGRSEEVTRRLSAFWAPDKCA